VTSRRYDSPIRRERAEQTRERIVTAGAEIVHGLSSWNWSTLTVRDVARRSGVHERTVYRHFATERALREAVLERLIDEAGIEVDGLRLEDLPAHVSDLFRYLGSFSSSSERPTDAALAALDRRRKEALMDAVEAAAPSWTEADRRLVAAMIDALWGVPTYRRLVSGWQLEPAEAIRGTTWLLELAIAAITTEARPGER